MTHPADRSYDAVLAARDSERMNLPERAVYRMGWDACLAAMGEPVGWFYCDPGEGPNDFEWRHLATSQGEADTYEEFYSVPLFAKPAPPKE